MGCCMSCLGKNDPGPRGPGDIPEGTTRLCLATFAPSHNAGYTMKLFDAIAKNETAGADQYETWVYIGNRAKFKALIAEVKQGLSTAEDRDKAKDHATSPFVWGERSNGDTFYIGGGDSMREWILQQPGFSSAAADDKGEAVLKLANGEPAADKSDFKVTFPCKYGTSGTAAVLAQ